MKESQQRRKKTTDKERVLVYLFQSVEQANTLNEFYDLVQEKGLEVYKRREKVTGVIFKNRKYRFTTVLGKERWKEFIRQSERMERLKKVRETDKELQLTREERLKKARTKEKNSGRKKL